MGNRVALTIGILLAAISSPALLLAADDSDIPPTIYLNDPAQLSCNPKVFGPNDTLVLTLGPKHGRELAITRNADRWPYFLVVRMPPDEMKPLMTPEQFKAASRVELPARIYAFPWVKDGQMELVFSKSGDYTIHVSEILESEV